MERQLIIPGKCIYCLGAHDGSREHVVPEALNGRLILPRATCSTCKEKINSQVASPLLSFHYKKSRRLHGYRSKKRASKPSSKPANENVWRFVIKRSNPPFQKIVPIHGAENTFSDVIYRYNLPSFLSDTPEAKAKRSATQIHHPFKMAEVNEQIRKLRLADDDIVSIQTSSPIFRHDLVARLVCKISCGVFAALFRANSPKELRDFILDGGSDDTMNRFVGSASRETFPMKQGEARVFMKEGQGGRVLYTALNVFPKDITEVYFVRVGVPDDFETDELSLNCLESHPNKSWFEGMKLTVRMKP